MARSRIHLIVFAAAACVFYASESAHAQVDQVDTSIGGTGILLAPTRPTVHLPNSMVRMYPMRRDQLDDQIRSFPLSVISHRMGELFWLMPRTKRPLLSSWDSPATFDQETATPYSYSVSLDDEKIRLAFSPAQRSGYFRFEWPSAQAVLLLANRFPGELSADGDRAFFGFERFNDMQAFVYGEFDVPVTIERAQSDGRSKLTILANGKKLDFRYGISFISVEQAQKNLRREIPAWRFDEVKRAAQARWDKVLGQIQVAGGSQAQRRVFYTALYRSYERMVNISEDGQYYSGFDHQVHRDARPFYVDNWLWDTYRALEPLHIVLNPEVEADKLQSYVRMFEQTGWMPSFAILSGDYACMTGNHAAAWMADAWVKGVRNFNLNKAYEGLRKNSLEATLLPWRNGPRTMLDDFYNDKGYFPSLHENEVETVPEVHPFERRQSISVTLGNSYDDWCLAQLARTTGNEADRSMFLQRAAYYKNVFRTDKNSVWPKDREGKWIETYDPKFSGGTGGRNYTTENNAYTYDWDVQHDLSGLFELMGGRERAEAKLDQLFREGLGRGRNEFWAKFPDATGLAGQFSMGNEPSFHIPYLYNYLGAPWKTQKLMRKLLSSMFSDTLAGIPGDEDGGGMSAFVVLSMMGFYPVTPGVPIYVVGSPVFDRISILLSNGKRFRIDARNNSATNKYIQSVRLNGKPLQRLWFRHTDLIEGGTLELQMGSSPNRILGSQLEDLPPSAMQFDPTTLQTGGGRKTADQAPVTRTPSN